MSTPGQVTLDAVQVDTFENAEVQLSEFWREIQERFNQASDLAATPLETDLQAAVDQMAAHCEHLGWLSVWIPDAESLQQQAVGFKTEAGLAKGLTGNALRDWTKAKTSTFGRVARLVERLSATINHRLDDLRTIVSLEKERWKNEMGGTQT